MAPDPHDLRLAEYRHRTANAYAVMASLIAREAKATPAAAQSLAKVGAQLRAHAVLNRLLDTSNRAPFLCAGHYFEVIARQVEEALLSPVGARAEVYVERANRDARLCEALGIIFCELAANAAKHAFASRGRGVLSASLLALAPSSLILCVSDDGPGCDFERLPLERGLGLVALIARQFEGEIAIASTPSGASFTVCLREQDLLEINP